MTSISVLAADILSFQVVSLFSALTVVSFLMRRPVARVLRGSARRTFWGLVSLAAIASVTLLGRHFEGFAPVFWLFDGTLWSQVAITQQANFVLNMILFLPAGIAVTFATRRPVASLLFLVALSFAIESIQQSTGLGAPDPADWVANSLGALVGVIIALPGSRRAKN